MADPSGTDLLPGEVIRILSFRDSAAVVLKADGKRFLIFVGPYEAEAIKREMRGVRVERPLTHDLVRYILTGFDIQVDKVVVSSIVNNIFCATLVLSRGGDESGGTPEVLRLDIRASDAIILALKTGNQIWITRRVLDAVEDVTEALAEIDRQFRGAQDDDDLGEFGTEEE